MAFNDCQYCVGRGIIYYKSSSHNNKNMKLLLKKEYEVTVSWRKISQDNEDETIPGLFTLLITQHQT